ncbi:MAG TPA: PPOX class F420-dependent oxidoreductase [Ktedonobacterales bacterium]
MITQSPPFTALAGAKYLSLTTFRKSGDPVTTPVWFAEKDGKLYVFTFPGAGKVKRIRHTARVRLAPCTVNGKATGPVSEARACIISEQEGKKLADTALAKKYGLTWRLYNAGMGALRAIRRRPKTERVYLAIEPAE